MATRLRWLGHSCLWIESDGQRLIVDPFLTGNPKAAAKAEELSPQFILVSHGHGDHLGDAIALSQRCKATVICNYENSAVMSSAVNDLKNPASVEISCLTSVRLRS